jgi:hypothetical protein
LWDGVADKDYGVTGRSLGIPYPVCTVPVHNRVEISKAIQRHRNASASGLLTLSTPMGVSNLIRDETRECHKLSDLRQEKGSALFLNPKDSSTQGWCKGGYYCYEKMISTKQIFSINGQKKTKID